MAELERIRASLFRDWCIQLILIAGTSRFTARANPRPPLLLSMVASRMSEFLSISATKDSVTSIGSCV